jgi:hypothetical protein
VAPDDYLPQEMQLEMFASSWPWWHKLRSDELDRLTKKPLKETAERRDAIVKEAGLLRPYLRDDISAQVCITELQARALRGR